MTESENEGELSSSPIRACSFLAVAPISSFDELPIYGWLKEAMKEMKMLSPTPIQKTTIKAALQSKMFFVFISAHH